MNDNECPTVEEIEELIDELANESIDESPQKHEYSFWKNLKSSFCKPKESELRLRFQRLAGIIEDKHVATLIISDDHMILFSKLPSWKDVIRFKLCGFKYFTIK